MDMMGMGLEMIGTVGLEMMETVGLGMTRTVGFKEMTGTAGLEAGMKLMPKIHALRISLQLQT